MKRKVLEWIGFVGSLASILGVFLIEENWIVTKLLVIIVTVISALFVFIPDNKYKKCKSQKEINEFMENWIRTDGVVKIFSRDLSWVDPNMIEIMKRKGKDLLIFVECENDVTKQINQFVNICYYGDLGFSPSSRFTIIHANKDDKQIAIALEQQKTLNKLVHNIYISGDSNMDKKILSLANDLVRCIECVVKKNE